MKALLPATIPRFVNSNFHLALYMLLSDYTGPLSHIIGTGVTKKGRKDNQDDLAVMEKTSLSLGAIPLPTLLYVQPSTTSQPTLGLHIVPFDFTTPTTNTYAPLTTVRLSGT